MSTVLVEELQQREFPNRDTETRTSAADVSRLFFNRELSLLEFHARVLEEAFDSSNPLLERLKHVHGDRK